MFPLVGRLVGVSADGIGWVFGWGRGGDETNDGVADGIEQCPRDVNGPGSWQLFETVVRQNPHFRQFCDVQLRTFPICPESHSRDVGSESYRKFLR